MRTASPIGSQKGACPHWGVHPGRRFGRWRPTSFPLRVACLAFALYSFADNNLSTCLLCLLSHNTRASTTVVTLPTSSILICSRLFFALGAIRGHFGGFIPIWTGTAFVGPASASLALWLMAGPAKALLASCHSAQPQLWPSSGTLAPLFNFRRATSSLHCKISTCFWRGAGCTQFMPWRRASPQGVSVLS